MQNSMLPFRARSTPRTSALKEAIVASFVLAPDTARTRLRGFEESDWLSVLWWLDISGMAIYFYHRASEIGGGPLLPQRVEAGLAQRLHNNRVRMKSLLDESRVLAMWFQVGNIPYALLKGVTLAPHSVPEMALRSQADIDVLIANEFADLAVHFVHRLGYRLHARSGGTLEFRAGPPTIPDLANIYSINTQRALELHLSKDGSCESRLLSRRVIRDLDGARVFALSPADILTGQARHLLKHLCGEHTRLSWVLEFWRHVNTTHEDDDFWCAAERSAAELAQGDLAMGMAFWLVGAFFGETSHNIPPQWRAEALPIRVRVWLERYARTLLLRDTVGNKLYALLHKELPGGALHHRTTFQILLPRVLPATLLEAPPEETPSQMRSRYLFEIRFILNRLWFHLREGVHFAVESCRWNRAVTRASR